PPGVGKTALALVAAESLHTAYPDGQLYLDLGGLGTECTSRDLLGLLLRALGLPAGAVPDAERERLVLLRDLVGAQRLLVVLDDVAHEAQVRGALSLRWSAAILTSRARLAALENTEHVRLGMLDEPTAVRLLASVAADQVASEPAGAAEIARLCAGLPLAVRLAGAKLAARPHWTASMLAARLADERHRLDELRVGDRAVRASVEVSYATQPPRVQAAFRTLGFLGRIGIDPWLAAAALAVAEPDAVDLLEDLVAAQLLEAVGRPPVEYRMHDLLRVFARERFDSVDPPGHGNVVALRVAQAYLAVALRAEEALGNEGVHPCGRLSGRPVPDGVVPDESRVPDGAAADPASWMAVHRDGARSAIARAYAEGLFAHCWALARALTPVLEAGGQYDEWLDVARLGRDAARQAGQPGWVAPIDAGLGTVHHYRADFAESRAALDRALAVWTGSTDQRLAAYARLMLAMTIRATGGQDTAPLLHSALDVGVAERDAVLEVEALRCLAWVDRDTGRADREVGRLRRALARLGDDGGDRLRGYVLHDLGVMRTDRGEYAAAVRELSTAFDAFQRLGDRHWTGLALYRRGEARQSAGYPAEAIEDLRQARLVFRGLHDQVTEAYVLCRLGSAHTELGRYRIAEDLLGAAAGMASRRGSSRDVAQVQVAVGELREAQGDLLAALVAYEEAGAELARGRHNRWQERADAGRDRVRAALAGQP
ncbi:MAG TPA: NB-ARC domain-containing protein, partial [Micromonosporaceae bacterium]|nr:NB-ARC domain-containing protein [Micromonosporaceae bacterium]